jgi:hypothetical protein
MGFGMKSRKTWLNKNISRRKNEEKGRTSIESVLVRDATVNNGDDFRVRLRVLASSKFRTRNEFIINAISC